MAIKLGFVSLLQHVGEWYDFDAALDARGIQLLQLENGNAFHERE